MTWGPMYMYYHCPKCGLKFEYAVDMIPDFGEKFGYCPKCDVMGVYEKCRSAVQNMTKGHQNYFEQPYQ